MVGWKEWPGCPERMLLGIREQETGGSLMLAPGVRRRVGKVKLKE